MTWLAVAAWAACAASLLVGVWVALRWHPPAFVAVAGILMLTE